MPRGVDHPHWNMTFNAPPGEEDRVAPLRVYVTTDPEGKFITSITACWALTDEDIAEMIRTRQLMMNVMGGGLPAHFIAGPDSMREFVTDFGKTWDK